MLRKFFLIGTLCICAMAIIASDAFACATNEYLKCVYSGGRRMCFCVVKKSTVCETFLQKANQFCPDDSGCEAICDAYGTEPAPGCYGTCTYTTNPDGSITVTNDQCFDEDCDFLIYALCGPKKCEKDPTRKGCWDNVSLKSVHFGKDKIPASIVSLADCPPGNCRTLTEILSEDSDLKICPSGLYLADAFIGRMNMRGCFCPGTYSFPATGFPECSDPAKEVCIEAFHEIDQNAPDDTEYWAEPPVNVPYTPPE